MERTKITTESECFMKYRDWNEMQRKLEALYVLDNTLPKTIMNKTLQRAYSENYMKREVFRIKS